MVIKTGQFSICLQFMFSLCYSLLAVFDTIILKTRKKSAKLSESALVWLLFSTKSDSCETVR